MQIQARVCDPNAILNEKERTEIDETLKELEMATRKVVMKDKLLGAQIGIIHCRRLRQMCVNAADCS